MASRAQEKLIYQLWYLGSQLAVISLFDDRVSIKDKRRISRKLNSSTTTVPDKLKKKAIYTNQSKLEDFIDLSSMDIFKILDLPTSFLKSDPKTWDNDDGFNSCRETIKSLSPVNDAAERAIGLLGRIQGSTKKYKDVNTVQQMVFNIERDLKKH